MNARIVTWGLVLLTLGPAGEMWLPSAAAAADTSEYGSEIGLACGRAFRMAAPESPLPSGRHYAPSRKVDVLHLLLEVTPDFKQRSVTGKATLRFVPIALPLEELCLDAVDLEVHKFESSAPLADFQATKEQIIFTFAEPLPPGRETTVSVQYVAYPRKGLYFRTPELGYKPEDTHLWTQGETTYARHWFPCFDAPNEKFTSEVICHVPEGMVALSNGRMIGETKDPKTGLVAFHWLQDKPHVSYLIALAAGFFKGLHASHGAVPLDFYTPASEFDYAQLSFEGTDDMMAFFEQETGVPYPWDKYGQVVVQDFIVGGMENTSLTLLTDRTLHTKEFETLRSSEGLVAHELAHQWFGDLVTCKDWAHVWLNEGFATYYQKLYVLHRHGRDEFLYDLYRTARGIFRQSDQTSAIVRRNYRSPEEQFGYLAYPKGGWVLHMLRCQLGEDVYRHAIHVYLDRHRFDNVVTEDLISVIEEVSGRSFDQFFDQWVYHGGVPRVKVDYGWDARLRQARLRVRQTQKTNESVLWFAFPLPVRFLGEFGQVDRVMQVSRADETFYFALPAQPQRVRLDPELTVLADIDFSPPRAMLDTQLDDRTDMLGRLLAVEQLSGKREALDRLRKVLTNDPFWGVRVEASKAIRAIRSDEALATLMACREQPDARVRRQVLDDVASFYDARAFEALLKVAEEEKNPDLASQAIRALGAYTRPEIHERLIRWLHKPSFQNRIAWAAIEAMKRQGDPRFVGPLLEFLQTKPRPLEARDLARALDALAWLAREQEDKEPVRRFLLEQLSSSLPRLRRAAIDALATLGDPKAIGPLELLVIEREEGDAESEAARKAVEALRQKQGPSAEVGALRNEILDLKKSLREVKDQIKELEGRLKALPAEPQSKAAGKDAKEDETPTKKTAQATQ